MEAYQYDDNGQPISLSNSEMSFRKLWRNIDALDLPHLNPKMDLDKPTFDPSLFFQKLGWAQAELGVVLDVVDGVLSRQSLRIQTISHHDEEKGSLSDSNSNTEDHISLAMDIFEKARNDMPDTSSEVEDLRKLLALRQSGWPVLRLGLNWFANYGYESILNLPLDINRIAPLTGGILDDIRAEHKKLLKISSKTSAVSISKEILGNVDDKLALGLLNSLDSAIYKLLREYKSASLTEGPEGSIVLSTNGAELNFSLVSQEDLGELYDDGTLLCLALTLYRSFIESRGKSIDV